MPDYRSDISRIAEISQSPQFQRFSPERPVAYFCAEFGLECGQQLYSGGLGVLAGDVLKEAGDRGLPLIGIGLYYREGYACESRRIDGHPVDLCEVVTPTAAGCEPLLDAAGRQLQVKVPIGDRDVIVRCWQLKGAPVPVYLLDTNCDDNSVSDRRITDRLYVADRQTRLMQEIVLGIGGLRLLEAAGIHPTIYHLNEGHSALLTLELTRHEMDERHLGFDEAKQYARRRIVLTNHTLVPAGHEIYSNDLVALLLSRYAQQLNVPVTKLVELGLVQQSDQHSLSMLAFRMAGIINAVSRLHATKAKETWTDHPMVPITNGVHLPTWDRLGDVTETPGALWQRHQTLKGELLARLKADTGRDWPADALLIGWARRFVRYKRPLAIFEDLARLQALARQSSRPVRLVISGHPHPRDADGAEILSQLRQLIDEQCADFAVYWPNYSIANAKPLVAGCDVWLNTPVVGYEACGTSGMKAALNGVLPCTTSDGWVDEVDLSPVGWLLNDTQVGQNFLDRLEQEIMPLYYQRDANGLPLAWEGKMRAARQLILNGFTASRMLREYLEMLYL